MQSIHNWVESLMKSSSIFRKAARLIEYFMFFCIIASMCELCLETLDGPNHKGSDPDFPWLPEAATYSLMELGFTIIFSVEFTGRLLTTVSLQDFFKDGLNWCDFLAILPYYFEKTLFAGNEGASNTLGKVKLFRVLRVLKLTRLFSDTKVLVHAINKSRRPLAITIFFLLVLAMTFATLIFFSEPCYDLSSCTFTDVFNAGYFVIVTVTTTGFGDQVPNLDNPASTGIAIITIILGSLYLAMPLSIMGNTFQEAYDKAETSKPQATSPERLMTSAAIEKLSTYVRCATPCHLVLEQYYDLMNDMQCIFLSTEKMYQVTKAGVRASMADQFELGQVLALSPLVDLMNRLQHVVMLHDHIVQDVMSLCFSGSSDVDEKLLQTNTQTMKMDKKQLLRRQKTQRLKRATLQSSQLAIPFKERIWILLENPRSSRLANMLNKLIMFVTIASIAVFYCQTMPELQSYGLKSPLCQAVIESFCRDATSFDSDRNPGCFVQNAPFIGEKLRFVSCGPEDMRCFGKGNNMGSETSNATCAFWFDANGEHDVCFRRQCAPDHTPFFDGSLIWPYLEWFFTIFLTVEFFARLYVTEKKKKFFKDAFNVIDALAVFPFYIEAIESWAVGRTQEFAIVGTNPSFLNLVRILKTTRILKLSRHFAGSAVLVETLKKVWRRLMIPLFFLFIGCIIFGGLMYETERGIECKVGQPCYSWGAQILTPEIAEGHPEGKRLQIQRKGLSLVPNMFAGTWLVLVTMATVGYGERYPRTPIGKFYAIFIMIFGAFYTAMPLSLVGGQFYTCYQEAEKNREQDSKSLDGDMFDISRQSTASTEPRSKQSQIYSFSSASGKTFGSKTLDKSDEESLLKFKSMSTTLEDIILKIKSLRRRGSIENSTLVRNSKVIFGAIKPGFTATSTPHNRKKQYEEHVKDIHFKIQEAIGALTQFTRVISKIQQMGNV